LLPACQPAAKGSRSAFNSALAQAGKMCARCGQHQPFALHFKTGTTEDLIG